MKIVIAGAGEVGNHVSKLLAADNHDLTIIDSSHERLAKVAEEVDIVTVMGNPTSIQVLRDARVENADLFVSVFPDKDQNGNIISALLAKQLGAKTVAARIRNPEYLDADNKLIFKELGIDLVFYPERMVTYEILDLLRQSQTSEFADFAHGKLQLVVFKLEEGSEMVGKTMYEFVFPPDRTPFRILAISREEGTIIPHRDTKLRIGDQVYVAAVREGVEEVERLAGKQYYDIRNIAILGGGQIGAMVAQRLSRGHLNIKLVDIDRRRCDELSQMLDHTMVVCGDGRNVDFLYAEDIQHCDAFVAVTSSSETNIMTCVAVKKMGVRRTIAQVENLEYIRLAEGMGVDAVINKKLIAASRIYRFTLNNSVRSIKYLSGSSAEAIEYIVNPGSIITTAPLKDIDFPEDAIIGGVIRGGEAFVAVGSTEIRAYDSVVVIALPSALQKVDKFFV